MRPAFSGIAAPRIVSHTGRLKGGRAKPEIVLGRKFCLGCGRWRLLCDFGHYKGVSRPRCIACSRIQAKTYRQARTPEQLERIREYKRIWDDVKRREQGVPRRKFRNRRSVVDTIERLLLPTGPLVVELERRRRAGKLQRTADRAGVPERTLARYLSGESRYVRLDVADKLALALGYTLYSLYGDTPELNGRGQAR